MRKLTEKTRSNKLPEWCNGHTVRICSAWVDMRRSISWETFLNKHATRWTSKDTKHLWNCMYYMSLRCKSFAWIYTCSFICKPYMRYFAIPSFYTFFKNAIDYTKKRLGGSILQQQTMKHISEVYNKKYIYFTRIHKTVDLIYEGWH